MKTNVFTKAWELGLMLAIKSALSLCLEAS